MEGVKLSDISIILAFNMGNVNELPRHESRAARKALWHFSKDKLFDSEDPPPAQTAGGTLQNAAFLGFYHCFL